MNQASHASAAQADPMIGKTIAGRYRVDVLLGAGGMGAVYRAHDLVQERAVALKVLHPDIGRDPQISKRFDREAQAASRLDHPNIVRVDDHGRAEDGTAFMVMELLEGGELQAQIGPDRPWPAARALDMLEQVLTGLAHAHAAGIVHRDLKPENIFLARDAQGQERAKIVDFGIAKLLDADGAVEVLTRAGMVFGTPRYMSPEQAAGGKIDERSDLYSVGLIAHTLLTGVPPFDGDDIAAILRMQIMVPPPPLPAAVPKGLANLVEALLEKSRHDRPESAAAALATVQALRKALTPGADTAVDVEAITGAHPTLDVGLLPADPEDMVGHVIADRYHLEALLGLGSMGAVLRATDARASGPQPTTVAVKVLHAAYGDDDQISARFQREAETAARLQHPGIVPVLDHGQTPGKVGAAQFLVMPLIQGVELRTLMTGPMDPSRARALMIQLFAALEYAHGQGVVHRDLKPENIFVCPAAGGGDLLCIGDFGLAKISEGGGASKALTQLGQIFGTPAYMSPEQARGEAVDTRADLYAVGVMLYELLAGRRPFIGEDALHLLWAQLEQRPPALPVSVPEDLRRLTGALLLKDRTIRLGDARSAREALERGMLVAPEPQWAADESISNGTVPRLSPARMTQSLPAQADLRLQSTFPGNATALPLAPIPLSGQPKAVPSPLMLAAYAAAVVLTVLILVALLWRGGDDEGGDEGEQATSAGPTPAVAAKRDDDPTPAADRPRADSKVLLEIDRALTAKQKDQALDLIRTARDKFPEDGELLWREGRALALGGEVDRTTALHRYGEALALEPDFADRTEFAAELRSLLRDPKLRATALDLAVRQLGEVGHPFLVELLSNTKLELGYVDRHRVLDELHSDPESLVRVDLIRQRALDLEQASTAPKPCTTFAETLDLIAKSGDAAFLPALYARGLEVPEEPGIGEDAGACAGLDAKLESVRGQLAAKHPEQAAAAQKSSKKKKKKGLGGLFGG